VKRLVGLEGFHVFHSHTYVAADSDHLDLVSFVDVFEDLVDDASNLCFENSSLFCVRCFEAVDLFEHAQRSESVGVGEQDVSGAYDEDFGAACADFDDDGFYGSELRIGLEKRLDTHIGNPIDFGFVERFDFETCSDVHTVDERESIAGFTHSAGGDDTDLFGASDTEFLHKSSVAFQDPCAFFDAASGNRLSGKSIFADRDGLGDFFKRPDLALAENFRDRHADARRADIHDGDESRGVRGQRGGGCGGGD